MAPSLRLLIDHVLDEIALCGAQGMFFLTSYTQLLHTSKPYFYYNDYFTNTNCLQAPLRQKC